MAKNKIYTTRFGVCPIRMKPAHKAEQISQLLFGEKVEVIAKRTGGWVEVKCLYDDCEGYMDANHLEESNKIGQRAYCLDMVEAVFSDQRSTLVTLGAEFSNFDGMTFQMQKHKYRFSGQAIDAQTVSPNAIFVDRLSRKLLNAPFHQGGKSPIGLDASGFTQLVYKCTGIILPRDVLSQSLEGETIDFIASGRLGDLAFFCRETERISHVGIMLDNQEVIHVHGHVRIDKMDHYGLFNTDTDEYTHRLKIIKRLL